MQPLLEINSSRHFDRIRSIEQRSPVETFSRIRCNACPARQRSPCYTSDSDAERCAIESAHAPARWIAAGQPLAPSLPDEACVYIVLHGWLALYDTAADGRTVILRFAMPGDTLTADATADGSAQYICAVGPALVCSFTKGRHQKLLADNPNFANRWRSLLEHDLKLAYAHFTELAVGDARQRVASLLWELAYRCLRREPRDGDHIEVPINQQHIGAATGLTSVHVCRTLSRLQKERLITLKGRVLTINKHATVSHLCGASEEVTALWV